MNAQWSHVEFRDCSIIGNSGQFGAGFSGYNSDIVVTNCTIAGNMAERWGGGILNSGETAVLSIYNSTIANNIAPEGGGGI